MPRLQFEITEEQRLRVSKVFAQYGMIRSVMSPLLDEVMDMIEKHGYAVIGIILDKETEIRSVVPTLAKAERKLGGD